MSKSRVQSLDHEQGLLNGTPISLDQDSLLRLSKKLPSGDLPSPKLTLSPPSQIKRDLSRSEPWRPLAPSTYPLATSKSPPQLRSQSHERSSVRTPGASPSTTFGDENQDIRGVIIRSFAPRVAVFASTDTEEFIRRKGFKDGLHSLIRPYGEQLQGKVIIRDSVGGSKAWDDFGVRIVDSRRLQYHSVDFFGVEISGPDTRGQVSDNEDASQSHTQPQRWNSESVIDRVLGHFLDTEERVVHGPNGDYFDGGSRPRLWSPESPSLFPAYLRKLLSSANIVPYETFTHPVACMIAVSSHHPAPIEALRQLYVDTSHGGNRAPAWLGTEYLRYYVLIHDEESDDITKSTALFDLMKRHFGLHCHLLRLRGSQCVPSDDDSSEIPPCEWLSAEEELDQLRAKGKLLPFLVELTTRY